MMANTRPQLWTPGIAQCPYQLENEHLLDPGIVARLPDNSCRALPATYQEVPGGPRIIMPGIYLFIPLLHVGTLTGLPPNFLGLIDQVARMLPEAQGKKKLVMTLSVNLGDVESGLRVDGHAHFWGDFRLNEAGKPSQFQGAAGTKRILNSGG